MLTSAQIIAPCLESRLFGAPLFLVGQAPLNLTRRQPIALLTFLLLAESAPARDRLAFLLWPDEAQTVARNRLRMTLFQLRESLNQANAGDLLLTSGDSVSLDLSQIRCDVREFLRLAEEANRRHSYPALALAEEAIQLYRGEFLEGFVLQNNHPAGSSEFENWVQQQRQRIERTHRRLLTTLIEGQTVRQNWAEAIRYSEQLAAIDPLDEANHRTLLQLYCASGQRHTIVDHFERMSTTLRLELGVDPLPETTQLYRSLIAQPHVTGVTSAVKAQQNWQQNWRLRTTLSLPMIGREREMAAIKHGLNQAMAGIFSVICVRGGAGSGKTRLLHEATLHFDYPVWLGCGQQVAQSTPYLAILRALRSAFSVFPSDLLRQAFNGLPDLWLAEASRLLPEVRKIRPELRPPPTLPVDQAQARLFEALTRLAVLLAQAQGGAFLVVDDLHDADSESLDWLLNLARHLQNHRTPLAIAVAFDESSRRPALQRWIANLQHDGIYAPLQLSSLSSQSLNDLVTAANVHRTNPLQNEQIQRLATELAQYSEGTPFIVLEILRAWLEQGVFAQEKNAQQKTPALTISNSIPESVQIMVRSRIAQLDLIAAQIFDVFALAQESLQLEEAQQIAGRDEFSTAAAIDQLVSLQLLREDGLYFAVSHMLLRDVAVAAIGKTRQRLLHRRAGEVFQQRIDGAALAAYHFEEAGMAGMAAQSYLHAAQHAWSLFATEPTLRTLQRAMTVATKDHTLLFTIHALYEDVLHHVGKRNEQASALDRLQDISPELSTVEQVTVCYRYGRYHFALNQWQAAEARLLEAQVLQSAAGEKTSFQIRLLLGRTQSQQQRYDDAITTIQGTLEEAQRRRNRHCQIESLIALAEIEQAREDLAASEHYLQEARMLGPRYDTAIQARLDYALGRIAFVRGRYREALSFATQAMEAHQTIANREGIASALQLLAATAARLHEFGTALMHYAEAQSIFQQIGNRQGEAATLVNAGALALRSGDLTGADRLNRQAIEIFTTIGDDRGVAIGSINLGLTLVWQGAKEEAESWTRRGLEICERRSFAVQHAAALGNLAAALTQQGRLEEANALYHDAVARRRALGHADACCDAASLALVYLRQGNLSAAKLWSSEAVAHYETERGAGAELGYRVYIGQAQVLHAQGEDQTAHLCLERAKCKLDDTIAHFAAETDRQRFLAAVPFHRILYDALQGVWADPPALV